MEMIEARKIKSIVKDAVKEAMTEELQKMRLLFFPEISDKEMNNINKLYEKPENDIVYSEEINI